MLDDIRMTHFRRSLWRLMRHNGFSSLLVVGNHEGTMEMFSQAMTDEDQTEIERLETSLDSLMGAQGYEEVPA